MRKYILCFVLITYSILGIGQDYHPDVIAPNAAALRKYTDIPVSLYSGTYSENIPVHVAKSGPLEVPVSLSYHASGIKPDQPHSWVGIGWNLNAGGMISRRVHGIEDEGIRGYMAEGLNGSESLTTYLKRNAFQEVTLGELYYFFDYYHLDFSPDEFTVSLPDGFTGKFYWSSLESKFVCSNRPGLKIEMFDTKIQVFDKECISTSFPTVARVSKYFARGFTVITENGIKYEFGSKGNTDHPLDGTIPYAVDVSYDVLANGSRNLPKVNGWHLTKIISPNDYFEIVFDYENTQANKGIASMEYTASFTKTRDFTYDFHGTEMNTWFLKEIQADNAIIEFENSNTLSNTDYEDDLELNYKWDDNNSNYLFGENLTLISHIYSNPCTLPPGSNQYEKRRLDEIRILHPETELLEKHVHFDYVNGEHTVQYGNQFLDRKERLRLGSVRFDDQKYDFEYYGYGAYDSDVKLPTYHSFYIDEWGYYTHHENKSLWDLMYLKQISPYSDPHVKNMFEKPNYLYNPDPLQSFATMDSYTKSVLRSECLTEYVEDSVNPGHGIFQYVTDPGKIYDCYAESMRNPSAIDLNYTLAGTLAQITYPTGGTVEFKYEHGEADFVVMQDNVNESFYVGNIQTLYESGDLTYSDINDYKIKAGIRIKEITHKDANDNVLQKESFTYEMGVCRGLHDYEYKVTALGDGTFEEGFATSPSNAMSANNSSSPITYSKVVKEKLDANGVGNGKTVFYYSNFQDFTHPKGYPNGEERVEIFDGQRFGSEYYIESKHYSNKKRELGHLLRVDVFDVADNILKEEMNYYDYAENCDQNQTLFQSILQGCLPKIRVNDLKLKYLPITVNRPALVEPGVFKIPYDLNVDYVHIGAFKPFRKITRFHSSEQYSNSLSSDPVEIQEDIKYNVVGQPIKTRTWNKATNMAQIEESMYPMQIYYPQFDDYFYDLTQGDHYTFFIAMLEDNVIDIPFFKRNYREFIHLNGSQEPEVYLVSASKYKYENLSGTRDGFPYNNIQLTEVRALQSNKPLSLTEDVNLYFPVTPNASLQYNGAGNLTKLVKDGGVPTIYLWGYNQNKPVAKIIGLDALPFVPGLPTSDEDFTTTNLEILRPFITANPLGIKSQLYIYEYDLFKGMTAEIDPNGKKTEYHYDAAERLEEIKYEGEIMQEMEYHYKSNTNQ